MSFYFFFANGDWFCYHIWEKCNSEGRPLVVPKFIGRIMHKRCLQVTSQTRRLLERSEFFVSWWVWLFLFLNERFCFTKPYLWFGFYFWFCLAHWCDCFGFHLRPSLWVSNTNYRLGGRHRAGNGFDLSSWGGGSSVVVHFHSMWWCYRQLTQVTVSWSSWL